MFVTISLGSRCDCFTDCYELLRVLYELIRILFTYSYVLFTIWGKVQKLQNRTLHFQLYRSHISACLLYNIDKHDDTLRFAGFIYFLAKNRKDSYLFITTCKQVITIR